MQEVTRAYASGQITFKQAPLQYLQPVLSGWTLLLIFCSHHTEHVQAASSTTPQFAVLLTPTPCVCCPCSFKLWVEGVFADRLDALVRRLEAVPAGAAIDMQDLMYRLVQDIFMHIVFGVDLNGLEPDTPVLPMSLALEELQEVRVEDGCTACGCKGTKGITCTM